MIRLRIAPCFPNKRFDQIPEHYTKSLSLIIKVLFNLTAIFRLLGEVASSRGQLRTGPEREIFSGHSKTDIGPLCQDQRKQKASSEIGKLGEDSKKRSSLGFDLHTDLPLIESCNNYNFNARKLISPPRPSSLG